MKHPTQSSIEWRALYNTINLMMCELGAKGKINTRHPTVSAVMDALHDIDDGAYQPFKIEGKL